MTRSTVAGKLGASDEDWRARISAQERSGISVKQFCKQQGFTEQSFYYWRKRLQTPASMRFALVEADPWRGTAEHAPLELCAQDLRPIGEESSERYEYIPAQLVVVEDVCKKYSGECTVRTATKPAQPIEKSIAGASLLAEVIVAKTADHVPLYRQEKIFERHGVEISRKTMGGWMGQVAGLMKPL